MVLGEQPDGPWTDSDRRLLRAYQIMQDESCGHCGQPIWLCRNEDVLWEVRSDECGSTAAVENWQERKKDSKGKSTIKPGVHPYAVPYVQVIDGRDVKQEYDNLPSRESYFNKSSTV